MKRVVTVLAASMLMILAACGSNSSDGDGKKAEKIVILESGGTSGESIDVAYSAPFTAETGVKVERQQPPDVGRLKAMVKSGNVDIDLMESNGPGVETMHSQGLIEELDWDKINADPMIEGAQLPYAFGYQSFALYLAARSDVKPVNSWEEFWDVKRQPGKRALPVYARYILPAALLADGVAPEDLYPLDIDRAFQSLLKLKDDVIFWEAASQTPQLLDSNEAVYVATWDNVFAEDGYFVNYAPGIYDIAYFVMPKGAKNKDLVYKFLHQMSKVENQVKAAEVTPIAGPSPEILKHLNKDLIDRLPTTPELQKTQATSDRKWWAENGEDAEKAWQDFKLKNF